MLKTEIHAMEAQRLDYLCPGGLREHFAELSDI